MAVINSTLLPGAIYDQAINTSIEFNQRKIAGPPINTRTVYNILPIDICKNANYSNGFIEALSGIEKPSTRLSGFRYDLYDRIHATPSLIRVDNLLSSREYDVNIWSAYFTQKQLTDTTGTNIDDCPIIAGKTPPYDLMPLEELTYTISVPIVGSPTINTTYNWTISGETVSTLIIGDRIVLFAFQPQQPMSEINQFFTAISKSLTGREDRRGLRAIPRRSLQFSVITGSIEEKQNLDNMLTSWQGRVFGIPIWNEAKLLLNPASVGDGVLNINYDNTSFEEGSFGVLWNSYDRFEVFTVQSTGTDQLILEKELENDFAANSYVMPVYSAYASEQSSINEYVTEVVNSDIKFDIIRETEVTGYTPDQEYDSTPIFQSDVIINGNIRENTINSGAERIDEQNGLFRYFYIRNSNMRSYNHGVIMNSQEEVWKFRQFLHWTRGAQNSFFVNIRSSVMTAYEDIITGDLSIKIENSGAARFLNNNPIRNILMITYPGGNQIIPFDGITADGDYETVSLTEATNFAADKKDVTISLLVHVRILNENIEIIYKAPDSATCNLSLLEVDK